MVLFNGKNKGYKMHKVEVNLKGKIIAGDAFDADDERTLKNILKQIKDINSQLKALKGRMINVPDVVSEGLFAYHFNSIRTNDVAGAHSYDCVSLDGKGIQVKSASIEDDLTSFGPTSTWDELYFMDFSSGNDVKIYNIPSENIYNMVLNKAKNETFRDQQRQGRRPRLSIKSSIIKPLRLEPVKIIPLED